MSERTRKERSLAWHKQRFSEEVYQAIRVRSNIGDDLVDEIADWTDQLNSFGKAIMRINYFLNPHTGVY